jgi:orotidine-5'-phosphate decarboxylase
VTKPDQDVAEPGHFGDRLAASVAERESQIVVGLDPDPDRLWVAPSRATGVPGSTSATGTTRATGTADASGPAESLAGAVLDHCRALIDAVAPACVAAKLQLACFERLGPDGWRVLFDVAAHARAAGLLVIADGKRGDVPVSAGAYAQALIGGGGAGAEVGGGVGGGGVGGVPNQSLGADAVTVNPLLGSDALEPFLSRARGAGAGLFVLVRTSNPGAADVQDLELSEGGPLWERLARMVASAGERGRRSGLGDVGAVVGATAPQHLARARELMPEAVFLLPGVGAQGGSVEALGPAFVPGRAAALITASRSIADAHLQAGGSPQRAVRAEAERLRSLAWGISG